MKYSAWIDFPSFSIAIQTDAECFRCVTFVDKKVVRGAVKTFYSFSDLEEFLTNLPYPPQEPISEVLKGLQKDSKHQL